MPKDVLLAGLRTRSLWFLVTTFLVPLWVSAQSSRPYHINGNAFSENCNCYTLTNNQLNQSGSVWNINKIDLSESFTYTFDVFLGCTDLDGADGIAFVLQPISTSIGNTGEGMGVQGVAPSVIIPIDTYQNGNLADPAEDHISININGDLSHNSANNLAGPVTALANNGDIEDCRWHIFKIVWDAGSQQLTAYIDGSERVTAYIDLNAIFGTNRLAYWGFSGATGGSKNEQRFCTSLNAAFNFPPDQVTCFPEPIRFLDNSTTFGDIKEWYWSFGDGTTSSLKNPLPHVYPAPGNYEVTLNILGSDGCLSDTFRQTVVAGSIPIADFGFTNEPHCDDKAIEFVNQSTVNFGTIDTWHWKINNDSYTTGTDTFSKILPIGQYDLSLTVTTREGCASAITNKSIAVFEHPEISVADASDACRWEPVHFTSLNAKPSVAVQQWYWSFGDGNSGLQATTQHAYADTGTYNVSVYAIADNGCASAPVNQLVQIFGTYAQAGRDTVVAKGQPLQLNASGGAIFSWSPVTGLSDPSIADPVAILDRDTRYILTATTAAGCASYDTVLVKVYEGPEFYVPTAFTPNNDGINDWFRFIPVGMDGIHYFRIYNRYGQLLYQSPDPQKGWDGNFNGRPQPQDTYIWMLEGRDYRGQTIRKKGTVTIIR